MKRFIAYVTGCIALIAVSAAVLATIHFLATDSNASTKIASSMLGGVGSAMGVFLGGALVLRFKTARVFLKKLSYDREDQEDRENQDKE